MPSIRFSRPVPLLRQVRALPVLALFTLASSAPVTAQTTVAREALLALRDSAEELTSLDAVTALRKQGSAEGTSRDLARMRDGFLLLRSGEISGKRQSLTDAGNAFGLVSERHADWAVAWYGIGLTERALARAKAAVLPSRFHPLGFDYNQGAALSFIRALDQDLGFIEASEGLADAVQATTRGGIARVSLAALNRAAVLSPRAMVVRARLNRTVGDRDKSLAQFKQALAAGYDPGVSYLEIAREQFNLGQDAEANRSYWAGVAASGSPESMELLRRELGFIAAPGEIDGLDTQTPDHRLAAVRRFWTRREVDAGVEPGERLREHFARYEVATEAYAPINQGMTPVKLTPARRMLAAAPISLVDYSASQSNGSYLYTPTLSGDAYPNARSVLGARNYYARENYVTRLVSSRNSALLLWDNHMGLYDPWKNLVGLDARGVAYMRYGSPDDFAGSFWAYRQSHGNLVIPVDYATAGSYCDLDGKYCRYEIDSMPTEVADRWRRSLLSAWYQVQSTDRMVRAFPQQLNPVVDVYGLLDEGQGSGRLLVSFAVPAWEIQPDSIAEGFVYPVRLQVIAAPPSGDYRIDRDTTRQFLAPYRLGRGDYLQGVEVVDAPAAGYHVRVAFQSRDGQRGAVLGSDSATVRTSQRGVAMSNLILGRDESKLTWWSGSERVRLNPSGRVRRSETLFLYYQTAGLTQGQRYSTAIEIFKATDPNGTPLLTLGFTETADGPTAESQRLVGLEQLNPGIHTIQVTIRDEAGTVLTQQHASVRVD